MNSTSSFAICAVSCATTPWSWSRFRLASAPAVDAYKKKLKFDPSYRNEEWEKFRAAGKIKPRQLAEGVELVSN
ncbi:MAG TPA: hypothetical protein PKL84_18285, partial [Candidatus Hydrogenedentes bacterium]|nr:hypothetical protein [Candidatus Hydrogenedentota bacterium]